MGKQFYGSFSKGKNLILQSVCMLLVCFSLVAGATQDVAAATPPAPVLNSVQVNNGDFILNWSQPASSFGEPSGGYDIIIDGVDTNKKFRTSARSATISGLAMGEHRFQVEARFPGVFPRSNEMSAVLQPSAPPAPFLESVQVSGTDFILTWSQPSSMYGTPDGGYDVFVDGVDQNNHVNGLSTTISGLPAGTHTFMLEGRFTESTFSFPRSNELSAVLEDNAPKVSDTPVAPVMKSVQVSGGDFVLSWSQPESTYGAPDGGYDIFIDGVDTNKTYRTTGLTKAISGLAPGEHRFLVEARYTETRKFLPSNELSAVLEVSAPTVPDTPTVPATPVAPVLESVKISGTDFILTWSQPESTYGAPDGGYDVFIDGTDQNNHVNGLSTTISGLPAGTHSFAVEARYTETNEFPRSNELSAVLEAPAPTVPATPLAPVLESVKISGTDFILTWSQPESTYGAPDGGYDVFIDGADQNNHVNGLSTTISGLAAGTHTFAVEARYTETNQFPRSNELSAVSEGSTTGSDPGSTTDTDSGQTADPSLGYLPVFPGAQGFGTETKAGRGGKIIKVTNLNDSGTGSLRAALTASGPRIVVFEVSGTIKLASPIRISNPYLTIAGQTAPSPGITIRNETLIIHTHDVLVQHIRHRLGNTGGTKDGIRITGANSAAYNVVLDHVSISWGIDENLSTYSNVYDVTVSNCIISEGLTQSNSFGFLIMDHSKTISTVRNLFAHNFARNPCLKGDTTSAIINNLVYNGGTRQFSRMIDNYNNGPSKTSLVGNVAIEGYNSNKTPGFVAESNIQKGSAIYLSGNTYKGEGSYFVSEASFNPVVSSPPFWHASLTTMGSDKVEAYVLRNAGARPADRDSVDTRIANEVATRSGNHISNQSEVGGWPTLKNNYRSFPTPSNPNGDDDGDGYTNIEEVLQQMAAQVEGR